MKKLLLVLTAVLMFAFIGQAQTAVDFNVNDCSGINHHLFAELDAGKIVVISFVMPCGGCIAPTQNAYSTVQGYGSAYPGKVIFYIADNGGSPNCTTLTNWAFSNSLPLVTCFADPAVKASDYGVPAMPKIVVLAGINHQVIFTQDDSLDVTAMQSAINNFLNPTVVPQTLMAANAISLFPNPAQNQINISYNLPCSDNLTIDVLNAIGKTVKTITFYNVVAGQHSFNIVFNQELPGGIYFARITHGIKTDILKFTIVH